LQASINSLIAYINCALINSAHALHIYNGNTLLEGYAENVGNKIYEKIGKGHGLGRSLEDCGWVSMKQLFDDLS